MNGMFSHRIAKTAVAGGLAVAAVFAATAAPAHAADKAPAASSDYSAFVFTLGTSEPTIYNFIDSATKTLDMTMYELQDTTAVNDLVAREKAGVAVRVILDERNQSNNQTAYNALKAGGVNVVWSWSKYYYTHQKTITVNDTKSLILTGNLQSQYYETTRDYGVFDTNATDVSAIEATFNADFKHTAITPSDGANLLWSPTTAQSRLLSVINGAKSTLDVEEEEFSDTALVDAIVARAKAGVKVRVVIEDPSSYSSEVAAVKAAGGKVVGYSNPTGFYVHAKAIVADYGLSTQKEEAGSMNFSSNSLGSNRELGIILTDSGVASVLETTIAKDFAGGTTA